MTDPDPDHDTSIVDTPQANSSTDDLPPPTSDDSRRDAQDDIEAVDDDADPEDRSSAEYRSHRAGSAGGGSYADHS